LESFEPQENALRQTDGAIEWNVVERGILYSAQQGHGQHHQTRFAHQAREIAYAVEASDDLVPVLDC
jgi:hypothetical protein